MDACTDTFSRADRRCPGKIVHSDRQRMMRDLVLAIQREVATFEFVQNPVVVPWFIAPEQHGCTPPSDLLDPLLAPRSRGVLRTSSAPAATPFASAGIYT